MAVVTRWPPGMRQKLQGLPGRGWKQGTLARASLSLPASNEQCSGTDKEQAPRLAFRGGFKWASRHACAALCVPGDTKDNRGDGKHKEKHARTVDDDYGESDKDLSQCSQDNRQERIWLGVNHDSRHPYSEFRVFKA